MTDNPNLPALATGPRTTPTMSSIELAPAAWNLANRVANTDFVPKALRGKPEAVLACILTGHELGIGEMAALRSIHVIDGRPAMSAELMRALVVEHGHDIWLEDVSNTRVIVGGRRRGSTRETRVTWTSDDAQRAGLSGKDNWKKYPRAMLTARATAELCRAVFPDVLAGVSHTIEELNDGDIIDVDGHVSEETTNPPAPPGGRAMRADRAATGTGAPSAPAAMTPAPTGDRPPLPGEDDIIDAEVVDMDVVTVAATTPMTAQAAAGIGFTILAEDVADGERILTEVALVEVGLVPEGLWHDTDPPAVTGPRYTGQQLIAMKVAAMGITDRAAKLDTVAAIVGHPIESTNDLTADEVTAVLATLNDDPDARIVNDSARPEGDTAASTPPVDVPPSGTDGASVLSGHPDAPSGRRQTTALDPDVWTGDQWRDLLKRRSAKAAELLKEARTRTTRPVTTLDAIAGLGIAQDLVDWLEDRTIG